MKSKFGSFFEALVPSACLFFTFFIFGPIEIYLTNASNFWFSIGNFLIINIMLFIMLSLFLTILCLLLKNKSTILGLIYGLFLAIYVQGNWIFTEYGQMDGTAIDWSSYGALSIFNSMLWIAIIVCPIILVLAHRGRYKNIVKYVSLGIIAMQCITLITIGFTTDASKNQDYYVARDEEMFHLSGEKNIIVMIFDAFQSSYFKQTVADLPNFEEDFEDFVFFDNAVGTSLFTQESCATILTGNQFVPELPFPENVDRAYEESKFLPELKQRDYDIRYYIYSQMVSPSMNEVIGNLLNEKRSIDFSFTYSKMMSKITAFRYMPHFAKRFFWFSYVDIDALKQHDESGERPDEFVASDPAFNRSILDGEISAENPKKAYRVYYLKGVHPPYDMDAKAEHVEYHDEKAFKVDTVKDIHDNDMMYQQAVGSIQIMKNLIKSLKEKGVYDQTDIIIAADHGWEFRNNPLLLIKTEKTKGDFRISHAPVSYLSDFGPTILSFIDENLVQESKTFFDYSDTEMRERLFYIYDINTSDRSYNDRYTYVTEEIVPSNFYRYRIPDQDKCNYTLGERILFDSEENGCRYFTRGLASPETDFTWTVGKKGEMSFYLGDEGHQQEYLTGEIELKFVYAPQEYVPFQKLKISSGNHLLFDSELTSPEELVTFTIPTDCIQDGWLFLTLEYPNAVSPSSLINSEDTRMLSFAFSSMKIY